MSYAMRASRNEPFGAACIYGGDTHVVVVFVSHCLSCVLDVGELWWEVSLQSGQ